MKNNETNGVVPFEVDKGGDVLDVSDWESEGGTTAGGLPQNTPDPSPAENGSENEGGTAGSVVKSVTDYVNLPTRKQLWRNRLVTGVVAGLGLGALALNAPHLILWTVCTLLIITFCVVIHEGGHFVTARRSGMLVSEFAAGFGPLLWYHVAPDGVVWSLRAVPMGGYVRIMGMTVEEVEELNIPREGAFVYNTPRNRFIVAVAGVAVNLFTAFLTMSVVRAYVHSISPGGVQGSSLWKIPYESLLIMKNIVVLTGKSLANLVNNFMGAEVGTVLSMPTALEQASSSTALAPYPGVVVLLVIIAMLNISLAVFNLLPLFPLDGGHVVLAVCDSIRNRWAVLKKRVRPEPLTLEQVSWFRNSTAVLVFGIMLLLLSRDVVKLFFS